MAPDDQDADPIDQGDQQHLGNTELRRRNADAMAASNRAQAFSGIRLRSRNCCIRGSHAPVHHQFGDDQQGSATRKRM
jgi:hypothetical protein